MVIRDVIDDEALAAGLQVGGCTPQPVTLDGTPPEDLDAVCANPPELTLQPADAFDHMALVSNTGNGGHEVLWATGTACDTDIATGACLDTLDEASAEPVGWGGCSVICSWEKVVTTRGTEVRSWADTDALRDLFGTIDTASEALLLARADGHSLDCPSLVARDDGSWRVLTSVQIDDCPITLVWSEHEIRPDGEIVAVREMFTESTGLCAGRLPEGIARHVPATGSAVAQHLARLAWLEGAAVVAFEHLAEELSELGAPTHLVARAREAARDEVRHAARLGALARAAGATVPAVEVAPRTSRSLLDFALHNATEGCVRETFGVVDAAYRGRRAPSARLRAVFAEIAEDEARHAALSWDIARWVEGLLTEAERAQVDAARREAHRGLITALRRGRAGEVEAELGAPGAEAAVRMAEVLWEGLAA